MTNRFANNSAVGQKVMRGLAGCVLIYVLLDTILLWETARAIPYLNAVKLIGIGLLTTGLLLPVRRSPVMYWCVTVAMFAAFSALGVLAQSLYPAGPHIYVLVTILALSGAVVALTRQHMGVLAMLSLLPFAITVMMQEATSAQSHISFGLLLIFILMASIVVHMVVAETRTRYMDILDRMESLAIRDSLTGLFNRRTLGDDLVFQLAQARRIGRPLSVVTADLDHFKRVNDVHGHAVGDKVLKAFADVLRGSIRESDRAYRIGGEEFLVVCPLTDAAGAMLLAEKLRKLMESVEVGTNGEAVRCTASFGVTASVLQGDGADTIDSLLKRADMALYDAKNTGRNRVASR